MMRIRMRWSPTPRSLCLEFDYGIMREDIFGIALSVRSPEWRWGGVYCCHDSDAVREWIESHPRCPGGHYALGVEHYFQGRISDAITSLRQALRLTRNPLLRWRIRRVLRSAEHNLPRPAPPSNR